MGDRNEKYRAKYIESLQPHVPEPVIGVGVFNRPGAIGRMGVAKVSPLASLLMGKSAKKKSGGLSTNVAVAITATKAHVFDMKPKGTDMKVGDELAVWDRRGLKVRTEEKMTAARLFVDLPDGSTTELEWLKGGGGFNEPAVRLLSEPVAG
jgi:hypothetical protein